MGTAEMNGRRRDGGVSISSLVHKVQDGASCISAFDQRGAGAVDVALGECALGLVEDSGLPHAAEVIRQSIILAAHVLFNVPAGHPFLMERFEFVSLTVLRTPKLTSAKVRVGGQSIGARGLVRLTAAVDVFAGDELVAQGTGYLRILTPETYARMRGAQAGKTSGSGGDGSAGSGYRLSPLFVLADAESAWVLTYDDRTQPYFDHPVDHVPGTLLIAAAVSASMCCENAVLERFDARFFRFVDLASQPLVVRRSVSAKGSNLWSTIEIAAEGMLCATVELKTCCGTCENEFIYPIKDLGL